ncbi:MAG: hypothetical protein HUJ90_06375, partial [Bacteroidales bacterium]|nr:hypothetical protein [Bacteroidales bacterium]
AVNIEYLRHCGLRGIYATRRIMGTMIAHSCHIVTNLKLAGFDHSVMSEAATAVAMREMAEKFSSGNMTPEEAALLENLARTEFYHWRAYMKNTGYVFGITPGTRGDDLARTHKCIAEWDELPTLGSSDDETENTDNQQYMRVMIPISLNVAASLVEATVRKHRESRRKGTQSQAIRLDNKPSLQNFQNNI